MAFDWTLIKTDTPVGEGDRQYWGYNLTGGAGMVLNVRLRMTVPGGYTGSTPIKGLEKEVYLPGDNTSTFNPGWVLLKNEDLGNELRRYEYGYETPGGNVLLRQTTEAKMHISGTFRTFLVDENYTVIEGATISGGEIVKSPALGVIKNYLSPTPPLGYTTPFVLLYQFDNTVDRLTDRIGTHDLTLVGGAYVPTLRNGLFGNINVGQGRYLESGVDSSLAALGAATVEVTLALTSWTSAQDEIFAVSGVDSSETEANNFTVSLWEDDNGSGGGGQLGSLHEYSTGNNEWHYYGGTLCPGEMHYVALTRESDGKTYKIYTDGVETGSVVAGNAPTGGSNARIRLGGYDASSAFIGELYSARFSKGTMSAAQVADVYNALQI
jgi:hypothetical protein